MREILLPVLLGLVQGITEFLPISSDGHLALVHNFFSYKAGDLFFDVMLHCATLLVVLQFLGKDFLQLIKQTRSTSIELQAPARHLLRLIFIGTIPAVIFGLLARHEIEKLGARPALVALFMIVNGVMLLTPRFLSIPMIMELAQFTKVRALFVGVAQAAAILPGISRSGCTITSAQLLQLNPQAAFRFSFYLFIPIVTGAILFELLDLVRGKVVMDWQAVALGFLAAYLSGTLAFKWLQKVLAKGSFHRFGYYCLVLGTVSLIYFLAR